jgi:hypothetical protein
LTAATDAGEDANNSHIIYNGGEKGDLGDDADQHISDANLDRRELSVYVGSVHQAMNEALIEVCDKLFILFYFSGEFLFIFIRFFLFFSLFRSSSDHSEKLTTCILSPIGKHRNAVISCLFNLRLLKVTRMHLRPGK